MSVSTAAPSPESRLQGLLDFLQHDQDNLGLIAEAAAAALDAGNLAELERLTERHESLAPLTPTMLGLRGVALLSRGDPSAAAALFETLFLEAPDNPAIGFNLAWARGLTGDYAGALESLPHAVAAGVPGAAALQVRALHHLGRVDEALAQGKALAEQRPGDQDLAAAVSQVAIDAEQLDLARHFGERAGPQPDGLASLGAVCLNDNKVEEALAYYDQALKGDPNNARALLGQGLGLLIRNQETVAAERLTQAAEIFGDHPGAWIVAGWARYILGDRAASRAAFERALAADDTFAESHGGLAVLDAVEGQYDNARRRVDVALRLDRACFSGILARSMLLEHEGEPDKAARIRQIALNTPIAPDGRTIASSLVALAPGRRGRPDAP